MGCNQSKAVATKEPVQPVTVAAAPELRSELVVVSSVTHQAESPVRDASPTEKATLPAPQALIVSAEEDVKDEMATAAVNVEAPKKSQEKKRKHHKKGKSQPQASAAFSRSSVTYMGSAGQENDAPSPKQSAMKSSHKGLGMLAVNCANGCGDMERKAVHFAAEPQKQPLIHGKPARLFHNNKGRKLKQANVNTEIYLESIAAFERCLTDASTLHKQLDTR